ncbi:hypothetical protein Q5752_004181 [Cryptotrichosporon argae]
MKYLLAIVAALAAVVRANTNSSLIPSNITSTCSVFLGELNADTTLASCVAPLINTTASFSPTSTANVSSSTIDYTLASLCADSAGCDDSTVRTWLTKFYSSCTNELTNTTGYDSSVRELYDILYVFQPLRNAVCSVDSSNQDYCVNEIRSAEQSANSTTTSATATSSTKSASASASATAGNSTFVSLIATSAVANPIALASEYLYVALDTASSLSRRFLPTLAQRAADQASFETVITPNATTYRNTNLPFLFLQPDMSSTALCTPCTREVLVAYIKWEAATPYALGLNQSPILGGQSALWSAIGTTCGNAFTSAITSEAGVYSTSSSTTSGAGRLAGSVLGAGAIAAAVAMLA